MRYWLNILTGVGSGGGGGGGAGGCSPPEKLDAGGYKFASMSLGNKV